MPIWAFEAERALPPFSQTVVSRPRRPDPKPRFRVAYGIGGMFDVLKNVGPRPGQVQVAAANAVARDPAEEALNHMHSQQHLPRVGQEMVNFPLGSRIDHVDRPLAVGACQARGGSEQSADERALAVDLATVLAEVDAVQMVQRGGVFAFGFDGQPCHLLRGRGHRTTAVVAADDAGEGRNALAQLFDFSIVGGHGASPFLLRTISRPDSPGFRDDVLQSRPTPTTHTPAPRPRISMHACSWVPCPGLSC